MLFNNLSRYVFQFYVGKTFLLQEMVRGGGAALMAPPGPISLRPYRKDKKKNLVLWDL